MGHVDHEGGRKRCSSFYFEFLEMTEIKSLFSIHWFLSLIMILSSQKC